MINNLRRREYPGRMYAHASSSCHTNNILVFAFRLVSISLGALVGEEAPLLWSWSIVLHQKFVATCWLAAVASFFGSSISRYRYIPFKCELDHARGGKEK
jgi:hypothetical protein